MAGPATPQPPPGLDESNRSATSKLLKIKEEISTDSSSNIPPMASPAATSNSVKTPTPDPVKPSLVVANPPSPPSSPCPSILRRSSLKRKRNAMDVDSPSSPVKRTVTFSDVVDEVEDDTQPQAARTEVQFALESHAEGDSEAFETLTGYFDNDNKRQEKPEPERLRQYLVALTSHIGILRRSSAPLVHNIIGSDWVGQEDAYVAAHVRFLGGLVSSQGFWLSEVLRSVLDKFDGRTANLPALAPPPPVLQDRLHSALQYIFRLVPSASTILGSSRGGRASLLASRFPHPSDTRRAHVRYVQNLLRLIEYAPELQGEVLTLVTERVVKIDVQVQVDFEDLADEVSDDVLAGLPALGEDAIDEELSDDESDMDDDDFDSEVKRIKAITSSMATLDAIMNLLFTYYSKAFLSPNSALALSASRTLLSHFRSLILPTYRSRHTQFLLFHFMQSSPALVDDFLGTLVSLVLDRTRPRILRQSAATYLASFVARGMHVPRDITRDVFSFIADQLTALRNQYEPTCLGPHPQKYDTYYALVQALLYIFCFRWRDLAASDEGSETLSPPRVPGESGCAFEEGEEWENVQFASEIKEALASNVFSPLNPLRLIAPAIAAEFVDTARKLRVLYAHHVLATNKRVKVLANGFSGAANKPTYAAGSSSNPISSSGSPAGSGTTTPTHDGTSAHSLKRDDVRVCLDGYFPFDPYRLPASKHWVEDDYREWQGLGDDDEEEEESTDDEDNDDDEEME